MHPRPSPRAFAAALLLAGAAALAQPAPPSPPAPPSAAGTGAGLGATRPAATRPATRPTGGRGASAAPAQLPPDQVARLNAAIKDLVAEADQLGNLDNTQIQPKLNRPHPAVASLGPEFAVPVLQRMLQELARGDGADFKNTYIRWHLLAVVGKASQADRRHTGPMLVQLVKQMPGPLDTKPREEVKYEPIENWSKYVNLMNSGNRIVGYPPFQRVVGAPESFEYMSAEEQAQVKANFEEAKKLQGTWKETVDLKARMWNQRIREINHVVRQYRGELLYAVLQTGDPEMGKLVMNEIDRQARMKSGIAFDLLAYVYLAAFDGVLQLYPPKTLVEMGNTLKNSAVAMEGYVEYGGVKRNFADYAFHMVHMLQDGTAFVGPEEATTGAGSAAAK